MVDPRYIDHTLVLDEIEEKRQIDGGISDFYLFTKDAFCDDVFSLLKDSPVEKFKRRVKVVDVEEIE